MTRSIVLSEAEADLDEILDDLEVRAGKLTALRYGRDFELAFERIGRFPLTGSPRPRLGPKRRSVIVQPYLIFYDFLAADDTVRILRILHSQRNITKKDFRTKR